MRTTIALFLLTGCVGLQGAWKAGTARADITPTESIWLAGFGSRTKPSEGVRQRIWVKALALEDDAGQRTVLVTADLLGFNRRMADFVAAEALSKYKMPRECLALNASHTHSAPVTDTVLRVAYPFGPEQEPAISRYTEKLLRQTVDVIGSALSDLQPATLEFGQGNTGFATNRRRVRLRHLPGPVDQDVPVLAIRGADKQMRAIVFGYACHATTLSDNLVSGDWPGFAQAGIESSNPGAVAFFVTGAGADSNALPRRTVELAQHYGGAMAEAVNQVLKAPMEPVTGPLKAAFATVDLQFADVPTRDQLQSRLSSKDLYERRHAQYLLAHWDKHGKLWDRYPYPVQVWQFGKSVKMILLGGELVVDYALRLKKQHGWMDTWIAGYTNDVFAYIPSLRVLKEGGYEGGGAMLVYGQPSPFHPSVEETIVDQVERLIRKVGVQ
ncbi:MAG: neutral/alkaline non-lysosomal ceramidase N-terminal domain-containing protein [Bryobacterales bacterium]|nr:neutral/alkaline non-lysosomal ceramidase N-terminal domain-containing protein [Bryobacterales bacterium]